MNNLIDISSIINTLDTLEKQIISLHNCSSDDFSRLNTHFKKFFSDSKTISNNATQIINVISDKKRSEYFITELNQYYSELECYNHQLNEVFFSIKLHFEIFLKHLDTLFIPSQNYFQNIMTLKLFFTNLNFSYATENKSNNVIIQELSQKISQNKFFSSENLQKTKKEIEKLIQFIEKQLKQFSFESGKTLQSIKTSKKIISEIQNEALMKIPVLTEKSEQNSESIAKIITNLQYHDIIRQKIEHVQTAHKELTSDLMEVKNNLNKDDNAQIIEYYSKVRDIIGLQASQLLYANKEYQGAIETITNKLIDLGDNMTKIASMCEKFSYSDKDNNNHYAEISDNLKNSINLKEDFKKHAIEFKNETDIIIHHVSLIMDSKNNMDQASAEFTNLEKEIKARNEKEELDIHTQILGLINDIQHNISQINEITSQFPEITEKIHHSFEHYFSENAQSNGFGELSEKALSIMNGLNDNNRKLHTILENNRELSNQISKDIRGSIEEVKYYDYFEKMIEKIIIQLNDIYKELSDIIKDNVKLDIRNLEHLKKKYTMKSEHLIHEKIINDDSGKLDLFDSDDTIIPDKEEDNIEFF